MDNKDYIVRASLANDSVRAFAISSTHLVAEARERHKTLPVVTAALGRLLSAGAIMGSMMKGDKDIVTISLKGDGPAGYITVTADSHGHVKGFPGNPNVDIPRKYVRKLDVGAAVGRGLLTVSYDFGLKEPYSGQVEIQTGEIAEDLAYYFTVSEQLPSAVGLGIMVDTDSSVKHAGGFIVQLLPDAPEDVIELLEKKLANLEPVTTMMEQGMAPEDMLLHIFEGVDIEFTERHDVEFYCDCSKEKVKRALDAISDKDLQDIVNDGEDIEVKCYFCNTAYKFSIADINDILSSRKID
ncbi:Hsp33 family molecular chaperone HslO [Mogibacterium neglectum]|uniref:Hsp33 family molecular chaperone HslO n=1 Tax=Mogibacterium neglectum TaxID=114528 RepID=UPI00272A6DE5|nr:Hsp33 family molecular chaperone HslO [Mogibacterium neglectum]WLD75732.1 Hsp33 family molecular chaperone HslO [Mogibacterium neglectum]